MIDIIRHEWNMILYSGSMRKIKPVCRTGFNAWAAKWSDGYYGVVIPCNEDTAVDENFAKVKFVSEKITINDKCINTLSLRTSDPEIESVFAALCATFINPGNDGDVRKELVAHPLSWWKEWKAMIGNKNIDEMVYDVIGELYVFKTLLAQGQNPTWQGPTGATYDIETGNLFIEVKSTIVRDRKQITASNSSQFDPKDKSLDLVFCQFEPSVSNGLSINSLAKAIKMIDPHKANDVEEKLLARGFGKNKSARNMTFTLHAASRYHIDDKFPKITKASFVGGEFPHGIDKISYTINLSGLECEKFE